jgi:hypothetical protein
MAAAQGGGSRPVGARLIRLGIAKKMTSNSTDLNKGFERKVIGAGIAPPKEI